MKEAYSCYRTGEELHVHYTTAFRWRHKVLAAMLDRPQEAITGIVEADEDSLLRSQKDWGKSPTENPASGADEGTICAPEGRARPTCS
jgi:hypothetical protein